MHDYRARFSATDMAVRVSNVTLPEAQGNYVLLTAADNRNNEIVIEFSPQQSQYLEDQFYSANRRREEHQSMTMSNLQPQYQQRPDNQASTNRQIDYGMLSPRVDDAVRFNPEFVRPLPNAPIQQAGSALYPPIRTEQEPQIYKYRT